jgi:UDP-GlcNAc3NAcA epimerase
MLDAMKYFAPKAAAASSVLSTFDYSKGYVLCTVHRAGNTNDTGELKNILSAVNDLHKITPVVLPLHPRTRKKMMEAGLTCDAILLDPVSYFDMIMLLQNARLVLTDSGGLQKEAFFSKKPCVTMRDETEWTELIDGGFNMLAGTDPENIVSCCQEMLAKKLDFTVELYGNGNACSIIADSILRQFATK